MNNLQTNIGIDVSKLFLDCCAIPAEKTKRFSNSPKGIKQCLEWIFKNNSIHRIVLEPTGGYEKAIIKALQNAMLPVSCVNARYIHHFAIANQDRAKTDTLDARTIAQYGKAMSPRITQSLPDCIENLEALVERRKTVQTMLLAERSRLHKADQETVVQSIKASLCFLDKSLQELTQAIEALLACDEMKESIQLLTKTEGIGMLSAANILAYLPEIGRLSAKEVARLVGVAPMNKDSGKHQGIKRIRGGRAHLRHALYMATLVAIRHNSALKAFYERLVLKGKAKKVAIIAAMRKLLVWLNAQMARKIAGKNLFHPS